MEKNGVEQNLIFALGEYRSNLFAEADFRIENKALEEKRKEEARLAKIKANTELIANEMVKLIYQILSTTDVKKANIDCSKINPILGKPTLGDYAGTKPSYYEINNEGLMVYLNYTREFYDRDVFGGKSFIKYDFEIDEEYLEKLLGDYGIVYKHETREEMSHAEYHIDVVTLTVPRQYTKVKA